MNPLVSIIVPAYNRASLIVETLESIRAQTYSPIELIVVDDGSTDETAEVVKKWVWSHNAVQYRFFQMPGNVGKSSSVNYALDHMKGEFVMILDSDDILLPDAIGSEVQFMQEHPDVGAVCAMAFIMTGNDKTTNTLDVFKGHDSFDDLRNVYGDMLLKGNSVISSTVLMRREVVKDVGLLNPRLRFTHDWEYWIRVSRKHKFGFVAQPIIYYRTNVAGASSSNRLGTFKEICQLLFESRSSHKRVALLKALLYQTKFNAWLAYHDSEPVSMLRIFLAGMVNVVRFVAGGRLVS